MSDRRHYSIWGVRSAEGRLAAKQLKYLTERRDQFEESIDLLIARVDWMLGK